MGIYSNGITGIDPIKLKIYESDIRNMANYYRNIEIKISNLIDKKIYNVKVNLKKAKENWESAYKGESGNVKKIIDNDTKNTISLADNLEQGLIQIRESAKNRATFYTTLADRCANKYKEALDVYNSSDKDFYSCAKFTIKGESVTYI